jgi:hypothetical protein
MDDNGMRTGHLHVLYVSFKYMTVFDLRASHQKGES